MGSTAPRLTSLLGIASLAFLLGQGTCKGSIAVNQSGTFLYI